MRMFHQLRLPRAPAVLASAWAVGLAALVGCMPGTESDVPGGAEALAGNIAIDGSSTVYPVTEAVAVDFRKPFPKIKVTVGVSGTGGGFKRFGQGETDISDASRPIKPDELEQCRRNKVSFIELPVAYDGVTFVVNRQNDWVEQLTVEQLQKIFRAEDPAQRWSDVDVTWPGGAIKIYMPGTDSGTFDYFKEVVLPKGNVRSKGVSANEDDNALVNGVAGERFAIGFFGAAYFFENQSKLKAVPIVDPQTGQAVAPTPETIESGAYAPFSRPLFIYVNEASLRRPEMKKFVEFYLDQAGPIANRVGYVALPSAVYERAGEHYQQRLAGTHFITEQGEPRSGPVTEVYQKENLVE